MLWEKRNVEPKDINNGQQLTSSTRMTNELMNNIVQLLIYVKEAH